MDNGIIYARDVSNGLITQLKSVDNMLLLYKPNGTRLYSSLNLIKVLSI